VSTPRTESERRARVLDPVDRASEIIFGLLMALTFTGSISVATAGHEEVRKMMAAALGCNLAWGLADAVMYLVGIATERLRAATLLARLRATTGADAAHKLIAAALPPRIGAVADARALEAIRQRLLAETDAPARPPLGRDDFIGALGVFLLVVLVTFPVVIPFAVFDTTMLALRVSNAVALVMLFASGWSLARHAGASAWLGGVVMAALGTALVGVIVALGG
jgi:VIT1/CCC1 family predicted Fe2+/Mn2+ transporter